ncbi:putative choline dehydrogenase [Xylogone sp. PMI_703]|nr:putative choline dehydrogenase [Xylogone sp. PMI_703]
MANDTSATAVPGPSNGTSHIVGPDELCTASIDYLVVGGGTAGLVVATRLSENPDITVGVLEAGPAAFNEPLIDVPGRFGEILGNDRYDWKFATTPQPGLAGRTLPWPRGKVLGGTSALNFMTWNRGCKEDYDAWEALGNPGWGWNDLVPYFKKSERFYEPTPEHQTQHSSFFNSGDHGTSGPIHSVYSKIYGASHRYWHTTLHKLGVETNKKHFAGSNVGVWTSVTSVEPETRKRSYAASAYYQPVASRANLKVVTEAIVDELTIEKVDDEWTATGARFSHHGKEYHVRAAKEVIVCAGSVQSPQLLELSGIGNPSILNAAGIDVKVANPNVGENLQEHMMTATIYEVTQDIASPDDLRASPSLMAAGMESFTNGAEGILTAIPSSITYLPLTSIVPLPSVHRIRSLVPSTPEASGQYALRRHNILTQQFKPDVRLGQVEYNFDVSNYSPYFKGEPGKKYATMLQMLQYPFTSGSIHIPPSKNGTTRTTVHDKPVIDPKYYQGPGGEVDFQIMVAAQTFGHKITKTSPLSSIIVKRVFPPLPSPEVAPEDEDFSDYVRNYTITDWHPVGTCAMGPEPTAEGSNELAGVVDARLRVHGVKGLRVVDASIMPLQVSAHIQATVYAIGEKGASLILEDYYQEKRSGSKL